MLKIYLVAAFLIIDVTATCITKGDNVGTSIQSADSIPNAIMEYAIKSYKQLVKDSINSTENIVTSPYSIWSTSAFTYLGARGHSAKELGNVLGISAYKKEVVEYRLNALNRMMTANHNDQLFVANKLAFNDIIDLHYCLNEGATPFEVEAMNFTGNAEGERRRLNEWVANMTDNRIKNLVPEKTIRASTILMLINAITFKGHWKTTFDEFLTRKREFTNSDGTKSEIDMMFNLIDMLNNYDKELGVSGVEMPYIDGKFSMVFALPEGNKTVEDFIKKINSSNLNHFLNSMSTSKVKILMPKFKIKKSFSLVEHIKSLGATSMFNSIDLSGFIENKVPTYVSDVFHQSIVEVNEKGTEAVGATVFISSARILPKHREIFFTKPFVFFIREINTNTILFMGIVRKL